MEYRWENERKLKLQLLKTLPLFVNIGDTIKIDTRTGEYLSRV